MSTLPKGDVHVEQDPKSRMALVLEDSEGTSTKSEARSD